MGAAPYSHIAVPESVTAVTPPEELATPGGEVAEGPVPVTELRIVVKKCIMLGGKPLNIREQDVVQRCTGLGCGIAREWESWFLALDAQDAFVSTYSDTRAIGKTESSFHQIVSRLQAGSVWAAEQEVWGWALKWLENPVAAPPLPGGQRLRVRNERSPECSYDLIPERIERRAGVMTVVCEPLKEEFEPADSRYSIVTGRLVGGPGGDVPLAAPGASVKTFREDTGETCTESSLLVLADGRFFFDQRKLDCWESTPEPGTRFKLGLHFAPLGGAAFLLPEAVYQDGYLDFGDVQFPGSPVAIAVDRSHWPANGPGSTSQVRIMYSVDGHCDQRDGEGRTDPPRDAIVAALGPQVDGIIGVVDRNSVWELSGTALTPAMPGNRTIRRVTLRPSWRRTRSLWLTCGGERLTHGKAWIEPTDRGITSRARIGAARSHVLTDAPALPIEIPAYPEGSAAPDVTITAFSPGHAPLVVEFVSLAGEDDMMLVLPQRLTAVEFILEAPMPGLECADGLAAAMLVGREHGVECLLEAVCGEATLRKTVRVPFGRSVRTIMMLDLSGYWTVYPQVDGEAWPPCVFRQEYVVDLGIEMTTALTKEVQVPALPTPVFVGPAWLGRRDAGRCVGRAQDVPVLESGNNRSHCDCLFAYGLEFRTDFSSLPHAVRDGEAHLPIRYALTPDFRSFTASLSLPPRLELTLTGATAAAGNWIVYLNDGQGRGSMDVVVGTGPVQLWAEPGRRRLSIYRYSDQPQRLYEAIVNQDVHVKAGELLKLTVELPGE